MPIKQYKLSHGVEFYDVDYSSDEDSVENRINLKKIKFCGRKEELEVLRNMYHNEATSTNKCSGTDTKEKMRCIPMAFISGFAGTGKSTLVQYFIDEVQRRPNVIGLKTKRKWFSISGKFYERKQPISCNNNINNSDNSNNPFSVIVDGLSKYSLEILRQPENEHALENVRKNIRKSDLGSKDISVLSAVAPDLHDLLIHNSNDIDLHNCCYTNDNTSYTCDDLKKVLITFISAVATEEYPLIIFLDDLQWVDDTSVDFINALIMNTSIKNVILIGAYRSFTTITTNANSLDSSNNQSCHHPFEKLMDIIERKHDMIKKIDLLNLSKTEIGNCISSLLDLHYDEALPLTNAVYSKTRGNISRAIQVLKHLERNNILYFCMMSFQWEWNLKDIDLEITRGIPSNDFVTVDVVVSKIKSTPRKLQDSLLIAAHTRNKIEVDVLQVLMERTGYLVQTEELVKLLDLAVLEGILTNFMGSDIYSFADDKIRSAAYSLLPPGEERDTVRETIGHTLLEINRLSGTGKDWMLFIAADHLNESLKKKSLSNHNKQQDDIVDMIKLNLEVGEKALNVAAFGNASDNLRKCYSLLKGIKNHWFKHYDISLKLYQSLASVELTLGNYGVGGELSEKVFDNATRGDHNNIIDALPTYISLGKALGRQELHKEAIELYWNALELVGEGDRKLISSRMGGINFFGNLKKAVKYFKTHTDKEILDLPIMDGKDIKMLAIMDIYNEIANQNYYYYSEKKNLNQEFILVTLRRLQISFEYGISGVTATALAHFAGTLWNDKDHRNIVSRITKLARQILEVSHNAKGMLESQTFYWLTLLTEGWGNHNSETIKTLKHAKKIGEITGDIEYGFTSWRGIIETGFISGQPLDTMYNDCTKLLEKLKLYNLKGQIKIIEEKKMLIQFLSGRGDLTNDAKKSINWNRLDAFGQLNCSDNHISMHGSGCHRPNSEGNRLFLIQGYLTRLILAVYFGKYDLVKRWIVSLKKASGMHDYNNTFCNSILQIFYSCLAWAGLAKITRNRKHLLMAKKELSEMKKLIKTREMKINYYCLIMDAQIMAVSALLSFNIGTTQKKVKKAFEKAIHAATLVGHLHHAALCHELLGEYLFDKKTNKIDLSYKQFTEANNLYQEWGCKKKIDHINEKLSTKFDEMMKKICGSDGSSGRKKSVRFTSPSSDGGGSQSDNVVPRFRISCTSLPHDLQNMLRDLDDDESKTSCCLTEDHSHTLTEPSSYQTGGGTTGIIMHHYDPNNESNNREIIEK